jgi:hypothetical protein
MVKPIKAVYLLFTILSTPTYLDSQRPQEVSPRYCGDIDLDQSWSCDQREDFWFRPQGSRMLPYPWFLHLEQADSTDLFRADANMDAFRFLTAPASARNPDALPVGFARDPANCSGKDCWAGLTCAACHTARIDVNGHTLIVDGAPGMVDFTRFLDDMVSALESTAQDASKFARFADAVLGVSSTPLQRDALHRELLWRTGALRQRADINRPQFPYGYARVDAFGHIFNQVMVHDLDLEQNIAIPNAPVSYPCLWDTPQHDYVQWNGSAPNKFPGNPLFRNLGEALGVFGTVDVTPRIALLPKYHSSISPNLDNLVTLEGTVRLLTSPLWPRSLVPIDDMKAARGAATYHELCSKCHPILKDRKDVNRHIKATLTPLDEVGTDSTMAANFANRRGVTGRLEGTPVPPLFFGDSASGVEILTNVIFGVWFNGEFPAKNKVSSSLQHGIAFQRDTKLVYKARPLNGVWATAPYLHNGSVPNLWELLNAKRNPSFQLGSRTFDPVNVGYETSGSFTFDTTVPGNTNTGHQWGTSLDDTKKWELIEFLKTL